MTDNEQRDASTSQEHKAEHTTATPLRVGITHGDTNGVGYEIIFKTFGESGMLDLCTPIIYGSAKVAAYHRKALTADVRLNIVETAEEALPGHLNLVNCFDDDVVVEFGRVSKEAGRAAFMALEQAANALRRGDIDVLVTAPICKSAIQGDDFHFAGHTEYLCDRIGEGNAPLMILCNSLMRVALVTTHLPIHEIAGAITTEAVEAKIRQLYRSLRHDFLIPAPRIAVLGLNPHNGDDGTIGSEESTAIKPAVEACVADGIQCFGPYPADGFFGAGLYASFDGILAMYHDQALAPFKALSMDDGVNFTAGLPFVRTSPDHGTAFDIAGQGKASEASFRQAVYAAIDIFRNRRSDDEATQDPLPKLYHERREGTGRPHRFQPGEDAAPKANGAESKADAPAKQTPAAE